MDQLAGINRVYLYGGRAMRVMRGVARAREQIDGGGVFELSSELGGGVACAIGAEVHEGWINDLS